MYKKYFSAIVLPFLSAHKDNAFLSWTFDGATLELVCYRFLASRLRINFLECL